MQNKGKKILVGVIASVVCLVSVVAPTYAVSKIVRTLVNKTVIETTQECSNLGSNGTCSKLLMKYSLNENGPYISCTSQNKVNGVVRFENARITEENYLNANQIQFRINCVNSQQNAAIVKIKTVEIL